jgi:hypothetical protein
MLKVSGRGDPARNKEPAMTTAERRELRSDIRSEIEEIDADLIGMYEELQDVRERIAEARARKAELKAKLAELRAK